MLFRWYGEVHKIGAPIKRTILIIHHWLDKETCHCTGLRYIHIFNFDLSWQTVDFTIFNYSVSLSLCLCRWNWQFQSKNQLCCRDNKGNLEIFWTYFCWGNQILLSLFSSFFLFLPIDLLLSYEDEMLIIWSGYVFNYEFILLIQHL